MLLIGCSQKRKQENSFTHNVRDYGAEGDSTTLDTEAIQSAIYAATETGGSVVIVPSGIYRTGSIFMKDHMKLNVMLEDLVFDSEDLKDYKEMIWRHKKDRQPRHLIMGSKAKNIEINGEGTCCGEIRRIYAHLRLGNSSVKTVQ